MRCEREANLLRGPLERDARHVAVFAIRLLLDAPFVSMIGVHEVIRAVRCDGLKDCVKTAIPIHQRAEAVE